MQGRSATLLQLTGAGIGIFALGAQYYLILEKAAAEGLSYWAETIRFLGYMTIWTNILVTLYFLLALLAPDSRPGVFFKRPAVQGGLFIYIFIVAVVYHFVLAKIWSPTGLHYVADLLLHYLMPLIYMLYWIFFAGKGKLMLKNSVLWLVYPLVYAAYALLRGAIIHDYPYPFIDAAELGYPAVIRNILLFALAYLVSGLILVFINNRLLESRRSGAI